MNRVIQEHRFGCGIACTAMIRDLSYKEAKDCFRLPVRVCLEQLKGTTAKDVRDSLAGFAKFAKTPTPFTGILPTSDCLLIVDKGKRHKNRWHWCVWDAAHRVILDPSPKYTTEEVMEQYRNKTLTINSYFEIIYID